MTVIVGPRRDWLERPRRALAHGAPARAVTGRIAVLAALVVVVVAVAVGGELAGSRTRVRHGRPTEAAAITEAAAYRFPLGCLGATLLARSSLPTHVVTTPTGPCWHYGVYVTAVLRRVDGVWHLVLRARSNSCPSAPLPGAIRALLAACAKTQVGATRSPVRNLHRTAAR